MPGKSKSIRILAILALLGLALLGYAHWVEPNWIEVNVHQLRDDKAAERIRIAQLSDLHLLSVGRREASIAELLQKLKPDLIVLSGDVIDRADAIPALDQFLRTLGTAHKVAVLGNWEYWAGINLDALRVTYEDRYGIKLLVNQVASYRIGTRTLHIAGMDDFTAGKPDIKGAVPPSGTGVSVLVQHSPGWFEQGAVKAQLGKFGLCLSGHTHGGQITLFGTPLWTPHGSGTYSAGFYETSNCKLYVSKGIGTSILPIRFGARPEIAVFDL